MDHAFASLFFFFLEGTRVAWPSRYCTPKVTPSPNCLIVHPNQALTLLGADKLVLLYSLEISEW